MKKLIFLFLLFPNLIFAQDSVDSTVFITATIKIIDELENNYLDATFSMIDSKDSIVINSDDTIQNHFLRKIQAGHYQVFLPKNGQKYELIIYEHEENEKLFYDESFGFGKIHSTHDSTYIRELHGQEGPTTCYFPPNIFFKKDSSSLLETSDLQQKFEGRSALEVLKQYFLVLIDYPCLKIKISAHASPDEINPLKLSKQRAEIIKKYFEGKGIESKRIEAKFFGDKSPQVPNDAENNRAINRRVEFYTNILKPCP